MIEHTNQYIINNWVYYKYVVFDTIMKQGYIIEDIGYGMFWVSDVMGSNLMFKHSLNMLINKAKRIELNDLLTIKGDIQWHPMY